MDSLSLVGAHNEGKSKGTLYRAKGGVACWVPSMGPKGRCQKDLTELTSTQRQIGGVMPGDDAQALCFGCVFARADHNLRARGWRSFR